jgi:hypothetical protein
MVTGLAQFHGHCSVIRQGFMRRKLARGILVVAILGVVDPLAGDSGGVTRAEDSTATPKKSDGQLVFDHYESLRQWTQQLRADNKRRQALKDRNPQVDRERRRDLRRGDFWTDDEISKYSIAGSYSVTSAALVLRPRPGLPRAGEMAAPAKHDGDHQAHNPS